MKLIETRKAVGHVLCHDLTRIVKDEFKGAQFTKGHVVTEDDIPMLLSMGKEHLYVWEMEEGMLHEDDAAKRLYSLCANENIKPSKNIKEGKIEAFAECDGYFEVDADRLDEINSIDEIMIATRHGSTAVKAGDKLAGMRVIPLVVKDDKLKEAERIYAGQPILKLTPYKLKNAAVITTGSEVYKGLIKDTFTPVIIEKLKAYGIETKWHKVVDDGTENIKKAIDENGQRLVIFFIRGCDDLQEKKALNACKALELVDASEEELVNAGLTPGFIGFIKLKQELEFYVDKELKDEEEMIMGANEKDYHLVGISVKNLKEDRFKDLIKVSQGDSCKNCGSKLKQSKAIEVGHIFKLGQKYSKAMNATFLDERGKKEAFYMGCYGIGVSRLVAVAIEASHDERGCIWDKNIAPFSCELIISNLKDKKAFDFANELYERLTEEGFDVLLDDRDERFGVKINDFELMGFPYALIIGKGLENGELELIERKGLKKSIVKSTQILELLRQKLV